MPGPAIGVRVGRSRRGASPLPALPLVAPRVAAIGSAATLANHALATGGGALDSLAYGPLRRAWMRFPAFDFNAWFDASDAFGRNVAGANFGVANDTLRQDGARPGMINRIASALAKGAKIIVLEPGPSDLSQGRKVAHYQSALADCLRLIRKGGAYCILHTVGPLGWGGSTNADLADINAMILSLHRPAGGVYVADTAAAIGSYGANDFFDSTNPNQQGADKQAQALLPILQSLIASGSAFEQDPAVVGNLLPNATFAGTSGFKGAGVSGTVPANWRVDVQQGASTVSASINNLGAFSEIALAVTPVADANAYHVIRIWPYPTTKMAATPSTWHRSGAQIDLSATSLVTANDLWLKFVAGAATLTQPQFNRVYSGELAKAGGGARTEWVVSDPVLSPPTCDGIDYQFMGWRLMFQPSGAPFTFRIRRPFLRVVADPRPAWSG